MWLMGRVFSFCEGGDCPGRWAAGVGAPVPEVCLSAYAEAVPGRKEDVRPTRPVGRPPAKHSSPDYVQMSVYVHKDVRSKVKVRLFETGGEFSALVESLLRDWLAMKK